MYQFPWEKNWKFLRFAKAGVGPSLDLAFKDQGNGGVDLSANNGAEVTFARATKAWTFDSTGTLVEVASGVPRSYYDPTTLAYRGFYVEEARTNLYLQSDDVSNAAWSKVRASTPGTTTTAPDGTSTAQKVVEDSSASTTHFVRQDVSVTNGQAYAKTVFAKAGERSQIQLSFDADNSAFTLASAIFTLSGDGSASVVAGTPSAEITKLQNGWYRCKIGGTATATATAVFRVYLANGGTANYSGDGSSGLYLWRAQLEQGAFATSPIKTTSAAVTRNADVATIGTLGSWFNASEGTLVVEATANNSTAVASAGASPRVIHFSDGTNQEEIQIMRISSTNVTRGQVTDGGAGSAVLDGEAWANGATSKVAIAYKANDFALVKDGGSPVTDSSGSVPTVSQLNIGVAVSNGWWNGWIGRLQYYPRRLPNGTLQALTR